MNVLQQASNRVLLKRRTPLFALCCAALSLWGCPADPQVLSNDTADGADIATETRIDSEETTAGDTADPGDSTLGNDADTVLIDADVSEDVLPDPDADSEVGGDTPLDAANDGLAEVEPPDVGPETTTDLGPETSLDIPPDAPLSQFNGLTGQALRDALQTFTEQPHMPLSYTAARDAMYAFGGLEDDNGRIGCVYTGRTVDTDGSRTPGDNCERADGVPITCEFNTEHSWAKFYLRLYLTEFTPEYDAAEGDIHHLFPSDSGVNSKRWHFDFLDTPCLAQGNCAVDELSQLGLRPAVAGDPACPTGNLEKDKDCVMQVRPERQGDIARAQFYMAVRYGMPIDDASEAALRVWSDADPPDAWETARNDGTEGAQGNRNPFIDRPDFVALIADF